MPKKSKPREGKRDNELYGYFCARFSTWINFLGVNDFYFYMARENDPSADHQARYTLDWPGRVCNVIWNEDENGLIEKFNDPFYFIDKVAFHEAFEISLAPIMSLVDQYSNSVIEDALHLVVRRAENSIFEFNREQI